MRYRNLLTAFFITALALVLTAGMAFSQNLADIDQVGNNHYADIAQTGLYNTATVVQDHGSGGIAGIEQVGDNNQADIEQTGAAGDHEASITQIGNDNKAFQDQRFWGSGSGYLSIEQYGNNNEAYQDRQHMNKNADGLIYQEGDDNYAFQNQRTSFSGGGTAFASISQTGDDNWASQSQTGLGDFTSTIVQSGNHNTANVVQQGQ